MSRRAALAITLALAFLALAILEAMVNASTLAEGGPFR